MPTGCLQPNEYIDLEMVGTPAALVATPLLSSLYGNSLILEAGDGMYVPGITKIGTAVFPTGTPDGTRVKHRPATGVSWTFQNEPSSGATYKWEFIGGGWLYSVNDATANFSPAGSNAWHDSPTPGPDIIPPFDGVYQVHFGARVNPAASGNQAQIGVSIGGADPADSNVAVNGQGNSISVSRMIQVSITANQRLRLQYRDAAPSGTNAFDNRFIAVIPVRCN
jgi:hypothetical protein